MSAEREQVEAAMGRHRETNHDRLRRIADDHDWQPITDEVCGSCYQEWPCDAAILAAEVEALRTEVSILRGWLDGDRAVPSHVD